MKTITCDQCKTTLQSKACWHHLDQVDLCSWKCVDLYAAARIHEDPTDNIRGMYEVTTPNDPAVWLRSLVAD